MTATRVNLPEPLALRHSRGPVAVTPLPVAIGVVWGSLGNHGPIEGWQGDGSAVIDDFSPPDDSAVYQGDTIPEGGSGLPLDFRRWAPGGSDGTFQYMVVFHGDGTMYVDKFDKDFAALLESWHIDGWDDHAITDGDYTLQNPDNQMVAASKSRVVAVGDRVNQPISFTEGDIAEWIDVVVFDTTGTQLARHEIPQYVNVFEASDTVMQNTSLAISPDERTIYFGRNNYVTSDTTLVAVDLESGTLTDLFNFTDLDNWLYANVPGWSGFISYPGGIVCVGDDFIIVGSSGIVRVDRAGIPQWWIDPTTFDFEPFGGVGGDDWSGGLARSGNAIWASRYTFGYADQFDLDGNFLQSIELPEPAFHCWTVGPPPLGPTTISAAKVRVTAGRPL